jgi:hypothetical protein
MQEQPIERADVFCRERFVVVGICIGNAATARRNTGQLPRIERFEEDGG